MQYWTMREAKELLEKEVKILTEGMVGVGKAWNVLKREGKAAFR